MMEKLFALIERFITAAEVIAVSLQEMAQRGTAVAGSIALVRHVVDNTVGATTPPAEAAGPSTATETERDYSTMEYATLTDLARRRGIDIPPRTRTNTVIKLLQDWDVKAKAEAQETREVIGRMDEKFPRTEPTFPADEAEPATGDVSADPFDEPEADPFGEEAPKVYTRDEVMRGLQGLMEAKSKDVVLAVLQKAGGVSKFKDLAEDKYSAIMDAVEKAKG